MRIPLCGCSKFVSPTALSSSEKVKGRTSVFRQVAERLMMVAAAFKPRETSKSAPVA